MSPTCPNCGHELNEVHDACQCVLAVFASILEDREEIPGSAIDKRVEECNVDQLWNDLGPIIDKFQEGGYDNHR
jgi:hypothetical protein